MKCSNCGEKVDKFTNPCSNCGEINIFEDCKCGLSKDSPNFTIHRCKKKSLKKEQ